MAIGFQDQFYFNFSIGDRENFIINWDDLVTFKVGEQTGNVLPEWEIMFNTNDEVVMALFNEGNDLEVSFGRNPTELKETKLAIQRVGKGRAGAGLNTIYANGHYSALDYISNPQLFISDSKSGVEVIRDVAGQHFTIVADNDFNVTTSEDTQRWVQHNISNRRFVNDVWMHSFIRDSFILVGITIDGHFVLKDMRILFAQDPRWIFTTGTARGENEIIYDPDVETDSKAGFINAWLGRGRERVIHDLEEGTTSNLFIEPEPLIAITQQLARKADLAKRHGETRMVNDNVHSEYWEAAMRNLTNLAVFSSECLTLSFTGLFRDIRVLDNVVYNELEIGTDRVAQIHSGEYVVSKVMREVTNRQFATTIEICRESPNAIQGSFRTQGESAGVAT